MSDCVPVNIHRVGEVTSTMDVAREMMTDAGSAPFAVLAEAQSRGRGTTSRVWLSPRGNMHLTICVPAAMVRAEVVAVFPLLLGLVCRAAITSLLGDARICLKWPNDIVHDGRKIGGSLVESAAECFLVGVGVNVNVAPPVTDGGRSAATLNDIAAALRRPAVGPEQVAEATWRHLFRALSDAGLSRRSVVERFDAAMDRGLALHRRTPTGRHSEPLRAVRLNEWGHLIVAAPNGAEETLMADYVF